MRCSRVLEARRARPDDDPRARDAGRRRSTSPTRSWRCELEPLIDGTTDRRSRQRRWLPWSGARGGAAGSGGQPGREPATQVRVPRAHACGGWDRERARGLHAGRGVARRARSATTSCSRGRSRRSRWCSSTRRRCCAWEARLSTGAAGATREAEREAGRAAAHAGTAAETRCAGSSRSRARRDHHLHVFAKAAETPPRFPRRAGIARKRPLGS